jgi:hypothetical protein
MTATVPLIAFSIYIYLKTVLVLYVLLQEGKLEFSYHIFKTVSTPRNPFES